MKKIVLSLALFILLFVVFMSVYMNTKTTKWIKSWQPKNSEELSIDPELNELEITINEMQQKMSLLDTIKDKKEWFIQYKNIISQYSQFIDPPETIYDYYSEDELDLLFRVVQSEIGDEFNFKQKCNVASVIFNRIESNSFPNEILAVLSPDQFSTVRSGKYKRVTVSNDTILACEYAFSIEDTTGGCLFFDSNGKLKYQFVFNDGAHNFYKLKETN